MGVALILMVGALGVGGLALLAAIAMDVHRGVGIWTRIAHFLDGDDPLPATRQRTPWDRRAIVASAQRARQASASVDPTFGKYKPVDVTRDSDPAAWKRCSTDGSKLRVDEPTPRSPVDYRSGYHLPVDENGRPIVSPMAASVDVSVFRRVPAAPPLGEDEERPWEKRSGTWTREGGR